MSRQHAGYEHVIVAGTCGWVWTNCNLCITNAESTSHNGILCPGCWSHLRIKEGRCIHCGGEHEHNCRPETTGPVEGEAI